MDFSHHVSIESNLRAELGLATASRDEAILEADTLKRQVALLQEDLRNQKAKLARVTQEKILFKREVEAQRRSHTSPSTDNGHSDMDYYKRKVSDLTSRLQASKIACSEKDRRIHQLEDEVSRSTKTYWQGRDSSRRA